MQNHLQILELQNHNAAGEIPSGPLRGDSTISHAPISVLVYGIDNTYLNIYAENLNYPDLSAMLSHSKSIASRNKNGILWKQSCAGDVIVYPVGSLRYAYHLQTRYFDLFLNLTAYSPFAPNACFQFTAQALWQLGLPGIKDMLIRFIREELGSNVIRIQPTRLDIYADVALPHHLTDVFLKQHIVSVSRVSRCIYTDDQLGTYYRGTRGRILCRIYNKTADLVKHGKSFDHYDGVTHELLQHIWRVEFELGRKTLHRYRIDDFDDIQLNLGSLWNYLTTRWLSLRLPLDNNPSRRPVHPWWSEVQNLASQFGTVSHLTRNAIQLRKSDPHWYIAHISGCLPAFAILSGKTDLSATILHLSTELTTWWDLRDFDAACRTKAINLGIDHTNVKNDETI